MKKNEKIDLPMLYMELAKKLAELRGITVEKLIVSLLQEEAAMEIVGWRIAIEEEQDLTN